MIVGGLDNVRWDLLSDAAKGPKVWAALARKMGSQALRMNLNTLLRHDVLATSEMVDYVADRIADEKEIRASKQFPYQYFTAYLNADDNVPQKIKTALHKAAEIACGNVPELPGPVVIGLDTSIPTCLEMPKVSFWFRVISENDFTGGHFVVQSKVVWMLAGGPLIVVYHKVCVTIDSKSR